MKSVAIARIVAIASLAACSRASSGASPAVDAGAPSASGPVTDAAPPPRCALVDGGVTPIDVGDRRSLVVGTAVATEGGFAVGLVRATDHGAEATIARVKGETEESWVLAKRGELLADAPPPIPLAAGGSLYGAYLARELDAGAERRLSLLQLGSPAPLASFKVQAADSMSFDAALSADAAKAALAWDDDAAKDGGIRVAVAALAPGAPGVPPRVVSDGVTDVDAPRLAPRAAGGWWAAWLARREEPIDAGPRVETPGEARAFTWIELIALDAGLLPVGPIRKLTSPTGHAASFDLAPARGGLDVLVRDETQAREGDGGRIERIAVSEASVGDPVVVAIGAGRGAVDVVTGVTGEAWLSFLDADERPRLLPLGEPRAPLAPTTPEDALDGARLLLLTPASGDPAAAPGARFLAAFPAPDGPVFRDVTCRR